MTTVYLDACCLNRPFDDQSQPRIRLEAEAVLIILERIQKAEWAWTSSTVLDLEIDQTPDAERRARMNLLTQAAQRHVQVEAIQETRARDLVALGLAAMDALHLACAESSGADVFLTTDDRLLRIAARLSEQLRVRVMNPLNFVEETTAK
jgi:predicted nucleic acid-binding protein